ncbi:larval cuticle protein 65Ag1 [Anabrus simplex]|uniref:larval cuticle protein 65Ag1 n=1 Tax=Anabrus simplex TaxID=316456 RepID=UPI0035A263A9
MNILIVIGAVFAVACAAPQSTARKQVDESNGSIIHQEKKINPDGSFDYKYETDDGEVGDVQGIETNSGFSIKGSKVVPGEKGSVVIVTYNAEEDVGPARRAVVHMPGKPGWEAAWDEASASMRPFARRRLPRLVYAGRPQ